MPRRVVVLMPDRAVMMEVRGVADVLATGELVLAAMFAAAVQREDRLGRRKQRRHPNEALRDQGDPLHVDQRLVRK